MNKFFNQSVPVKDGWKEEGNALAFKDHNDFFDKFHELRGLFTESIGKSLFDPEILKDSVSYIYGLIQWTSIYIEKMQDSQIKEIDGVMNEIISHLKRNETSITRTKLKELFRKLNVIYEFNELIPQVIIKPKEVTEDLDVITKGALQAYNLVYAKPNK